MGSLMQMTTHKALYCVFNFVTGHLIPSTKCDSEFTGDQPQFEEIQYLCNYMKHTLLSDLQIKAHNHAILKLVR